jgi:RNA polymerase sigma factor (sigma-70 family)
MTEPFTSDLPNMERSPVETVNTEPLRLTSLRSDADLIAAARSGDAEAYGVLYQRHSAAADRLARQIVKHPADVDDVVAETFARVLHALKRGLGPAQAFRPYLLTAVRRVAIDLLRGQRKQIPTEEADLPDPGEPFSDPVIADLDRSIVARAFTSLPERWSAVLWHTEVEESKPAEVAELLGISANGVSALSYRAREGLKQAYLQLHMSDHTDANCKPIATKLGGYVRGRLSRRTSREVEKHLRNCAECTAAYADLSAINHSLRGALAPVMLGSRVRGGGNQSGPGFGDRTRSRLGQSRGRQPGCGSRARSNSRSRNSRSRRGAASSHGTCVRPSQRGLAAQHADRSRLPPVRPPDVAPPGRADHWRCPSRRLAHAAALAPDPSGLEPSRVGPLRSQPQQQPAWRPRLWRPRLRRPAGRPANWVRPGPVGLAVSLRILRPPWIAGRPEGQAVSLTEFVEAPD